MNTAPQMSRLRGNLLLNEPMSRHTSWRIGGPADRYYQPADIDDLSQYLKQLPEKVFLEVFDGVPSAEVSKARFEEGLDMIAALAAETGFFASNGEARRELKQQSISVNKSKVGEDYSLSAEDLIASKYVLLQKGKKNYYLLKVV